MIREVVAEETEELSPEAADGSSEAEAADEEDERPQLEPIGMVERELTAPDGKRVKVQVPVYPAFKVESYPPAAAGRGPTSKRRAPRKKTNAA